MCLAPTCVLRRLDLPKWPTKYGRIPSSFFRWENLAPEGLSNLPRIKQLFNWGYWIFNQGSLRQCCKPLFCTAFLSFCLFLLLLLLFFFFCEREEGATSLPS